MRTITLFTSIFALFILSYSCVGPKGEDGLDGNANVESAIYDIPASYWEGNIDGFVTTLDVPEINNDIYENGAVLVYKLINENTANKKFIQLPYTYLYNNTTEYMDFDVYIGSIDITIRWVDNGINNTEAPTEFYTFKIIVIEGIPMSVLKTKTDISNPDAVMDYLSMNTVF